MDESEADIILLSVNLINLQLPAQSQAAVIIISEALKRARSPC